MVARTSQTTWSVSFRTADLDEARAICGEHFYPRSLRLLEPSAEMSARFDFLRLGRLVLGDLQYGAEISGRCGALGAYHLNLPLRGVFCARQGRRSIQGSATRAGVYRPAGGVILDRSSADCRIIALKIGTELLENHLEVLLDRPVRGPLRLGSAVDVTCDAGHDWASLMRLVAADITNPDGLVHQPIVSNPLRECLLTLTLLAAGHQYRDLLELPGPRCPRRDVARAVDAIQANPRLPFTTAMLADTAGVSVRSLQRSFRRDLGMSPMAYLRRVRLDGLHRDLMLADPDHTTAAELAGRWGFAYPGRVVTGYRARYGVTPTQTLHGAAPP